MMTSVASDRPIDSCHTAAMPQARLLLCLAYAAMALVALIGTWSQNVAYLHPGDGAAALVLANLRFWPDTLRTPAGVSITVDIALFFLAAGVWMVLEARCLGIRFVWVYVVLGFVIAISVTFPLFLIARERRLAAVGQRADVGLTRGDTIALAVFGAAVLAFTAWTLAQ